MWLEKERDSDDLGYGRIVVWCGVDDLGWMEWLDDGVGRCVL